MSLHIAKLFGPPVVLDPAAPVLPIGAATAADFTGNIQQQIQGVLAGASTAPSTPQSGPRDANLTTTSAVAQVFVTQVLLGTTASPLETIKHVEVAVASGQTESQNRAVACSELRAAATRPVLLGKHYTSDAT